MSWKEHLGFILVTQIFNIFSNETSTDPQTSRYGNNHRFYRSRPVWNKHCDWMANGRVRTDEHVAWKCIRKYILLESKCSKILTQFQFGYRYEYATEYVHVMKDLWKTGVSNLKGKHFQMNDCKMSPLPSKEVQIVAACQSAKVCLIHCQFSVSTLC